MVDNLVEHADLAEVGPRASDRWFAWLKRRERIVLLLAVGLQIVVLLAMIAGRSEPLVRGQTVLLRVAPINPRDLFRGDYVILSYRFNRIPSSGIEGLPRYTYPSKELQGRTVYVSLVPERDGKHWRAERFTAERPAGGTFLRGTIGRGNQIHFGIESYYVQEGTGLKYEQAVRDGRLYAKVAVSPSGQAVLRGLQIEP